MRRETSGSKGRYVLQRGAEEAELTYSIASATLIIADHTEVPESFRGTGAGLALI
ncbi:MAG: N-acetyltransferase, partial [Paracoccaceae bacterium]|nr:N-acetyltransferase [Paracoccaceae bacterium]